MTRWLALLVGHAAATSPKSSERIQAVTDTLKDLLKSVENEEEAETKNFKCYTAWCEEEHSTNGQSVEDAELKIEDMKVSVNQHQSAIERNEFALKNDGADVAEIQDALDQATAIREEEQEKYARDRVLSQQSVGQLQDALKIVKKVNAVGLLQGQQKLQISAPGESSFVEGIFSSLLKNLVRNQDKSEGIENQKKQMYDNLHASKTQQLNLVQSDMRAKNTVRAEEKAKLVDTQNDLTTTEGALAASRKRLEDTGDDCAAEQKAWAERTEDRQKEKAAIREAVSYLSIAFATDEAEAAAPAFVQLGMLQTGSLQALSTDLSSLSQKVGSAARADHFESVKKVILQLIGVLENEQKDEDAKVDWCEVELKKTTSSHEGKSDTVERSDAAIAKSKALIGELLQGADSLQATIDKQEASQQEAGKLRKDQKVLYETGKKDRDLSLKVLEQATKVLAKFYASEAPALLEKTAQAPEVGDSKRHTGESNVVLAMLAKIMDDIKLEQKHAGEEEAKAAKAFDAYVLDCRHNFDSLMMEITEKVTRRAKQEVKLESYTEDNESASTSLAAISTKLDATKRECEPLIENHEKRAKARRFEIDQLKDAREILSGSQIAARTAFLSAERSFLQQKTSDAVLRQLQGVSRTVGQLVANA